jgi:hypothetical protein
VQARDFAGCAAWNMSALLRTELPAVAGDQATQARETPVRERRRGSESQSGGRARQSGAGEAVGTSPRASVFPAA